MTIHDRYVVRYCHHGIGNIERDDIAFLHVENLM